MKIFYYFKSETVYFYKRVNPNVRRIVLSNIYKSIVSPIVSTFLNAFVWRITGSLMGVTVYNIGMVIGLPVAFYINGALLRYIHIKKLFAWSAILAGFTGAIFVFSGNSNMFVLFFYGCIWGLGNGLYWANRNYLELKETFSEVRMYFYGLLQSISSIASILVPLFAGWFIVFGSFSHLYSFQQAYCILFAFSFILMLLCGIVIFHGAFESPLPKSITLSTAPFLNKRQMLNIASGFIDGAPFISTLLILLVLGNEGVLGSLSGAVSLATAIVTYVFGRYAKPNSEWGTVLASSLLFLISGVCLIIFPLKTGIVSYVLIYGIAINFFYMAITPVLFSMSEEEMGGDTNSHYSFIFDNELFLNIGRLITLIMIIWIAFLKSELTALIYAQISIGLVHVILVLILFGMRNRNKK